MGGGGRGRSGAHKLRILRGGAIDIRGTNGFVSGLMNDTTEKKPGLDNPTTGVCSVGQTKIGKLV